MIVRFKKLIPEAVTPSYSREGDAGLDLTAMSKEWDEERQLVIMGTGIAVEIPYGYVGLIFPRSSICKTPLILSNHVGVVDSNYRGEIKFMFRPGDRPRKNYEIGDRIGQLIIMEYPIIEVRETLELSNTNRGEQGFGSSGS